MNRKDFLRTTALATIALNVSFLTGVYSCGKAENGDITSADLEKISPELQSKINALWLRLKNTGWLGYLKSQGLELPETADAKMLINPIDSKKLEELKLVKGFEDFGGKRLIEPGYPALGLVYHMLANPLVRPAGIALENYAELQDMDLLEDYIYGLKKWDTYKSAYDVSSNDELVLAVFAYEYRTAHKTPHHSFADMVFSRTGVGRIGTDLHLFDKMNRCYTNNPSENENDKAIAVTPARYGLFIAKKTKLTKPGNLISTMKMATDKPDKHYIKNNNDYDYLIPIRKVFHDDVLTDSAKITFSESHKSVKISKILDDDPDYIKYSKDLVLQEPLNSSVLIASKKASLVNPVMKNGERVLVDYKAVYTEDSRYFTAYYNGNGSIVEDIDIYNSVKKEREANEYANPRNKPMYLNLSHKVKQDSLIVGRNRTNNDSFEKEIYSTIMTPIFEDNLCDGYVAAAVAIPASNTLAEVFSRGALNAFSIITAPDFFPQVDDYDFQQFDIAPGASKTSLFYEGGIASLANCSVHPNPVVYEGTDSGLLKHNAKETYTTVICNYTDEKAVAKFNDPAIRKGYFFSSYLPDMCSSVFAPGWDVTYCGEVGDIFLSTQGLGAPFVEDMKLCAAMNGMWPAASPDAARTYQGSVTVEELEYKQKEWLRNPAAVPLTDHELGNNKYAPACKEHHQPESFGWDGEQGPFLELNSGKWCVNFTDLGRADYVENAMHDRFDMSQLRKLDSSEANFRMHCLQQCIAALDYKTYPNGVNDAWLVSAEKVDWNKKADGFNIPKHLVNTQNNDWAVMPQKDIKGNGYLYVFVLFTPDADAKAKKWVVDDESGKNAVKRRRIDCDEIIVCQVAQGKVRYYKITNPATPYDASKWV
jgi:hypothetical protein